MNINQTQIPAEVLMTLTQSRLKNYILVISKRNSAFGSTRDYSQGRILAVKNFVFVRPDQKQANLLAFNVTGNY